MSEPWEIAVVITTFNSEKFIGEALDSIALQTLAPVEIVIVDNGSTDATEKIAVSKGVPFYIQTTGHVGTSRNLGLEVTKSAFVKFLDSDDLLRPNALQELMTGMVAQGTNYVYGKNTNFVDESYTVAQEKAIAHTTIPIAAATTLNSLMHRSIFDSYGLPEEDNHSWNRWFVQASEQGLRAAEIDAHVGLRRIHDANISHKEDAKTELFNLIAAKLKRQRLSDEA